MIRFLDRLKKGCSMLPVVLERPIEDVGKEIPVGMFMTRPKPLLLPLTGN